MKRLHFMVEGPTEREFVNNVLGPHLLQYGKVCDARLLTTSRDWSGGCFYKGGMVSYGKLKYQLELAIKEDHSEGSLFTTMLDYYGLPNNFPGLSAVPENANPKNIVTNVENALLCDISRAFPSLAIATIFVPNIMCHEFESLLLSDCTMLADYYIGSEASLSTLSMQVNQIGDPELVNSSPDTAPSKRILAAIPEYDKVTAGALVAMDIGLPLLRQKCVRFNEWISKLETL